MVFYPRSAGTVTLRVDTVVEIKIAFKLTNMILQHCPLHDAMRRDTWPDPTLLRDKL